MRLLKWIATGNWRASTLMTGGGILNSFRLSVKSSTRRVADMTNNFMGKPFCRGDRERIWAWNNSLMMLYVIKCVKNITHSSVNHLISERNDARQQSNEDVCVHTAFVCFVYDDGTVLLQQEILWDKTVKSYKLGWIKNYTWRHLLK